MKLHSGPLSLFSDKKQTAIILISLAAESSGFIPQGRPKAGANSQGRNRPA
jgi:hypothetical protein